MRQKERYLLITFQATTEAMGFEETAKMEGLKGRIIPLPPTISAGCGLAWKGSLEQRNVLEEFLKKHHFKHDKIVECLL
ncbi:MAG: DUF3343 domain-containing protein [Peptostreptococcales bacterium]